MSRTCGYIGERVRFMMFLLPNAGFKVRLAPVWDIHGTEAPANVYESKFRCVGSVFDVGRRTKNVLRHGHIYAFDERRVSIGKVNVCDISNLAHHVLPTAVMDMETATEQMALSFIDKTNVPMPMARTLCKTVLRIMVKSTTTVCMTPSGHLRSNISRNITAQECVCRFDYLPPDTRLIPIPAPVQPALGSDPTVFHTAHPLPFVFPPPGATITEQIEFGRLYYTSMAKLKPGVPEYQSACFAYDQMYHSRESKPDDEMSVDDEEEDDD